MSTLGTFIAGNAFTGIAVEQIAIYCVRDDGAELPISFGILAIVRFLKLSKMMIDHLE